MKVPGSNIIYTADGPFLKKEELKEEAGVYIVLDMPFTFSTKWRIIDVGQSKNVRDRVTNNHPRESCWHHESPIFSKFAMIPARDETVRTMIEKDLRNKYNPPCGDR